jgi:tRNA nucleotidyltransferase (CCA-adding enzyme)
MEKILLPKEIESVISTLAQKGFEAYAVGGSVRDLLMGKEPKDWDVTTNAAPEQIQSIFPRTFYENKFFTVTVQTDSESPNLKEIEVTTYRSEGKYEDSRHPSEIKPAESLVEDLSRRDFTVNAMAVSAEGEVIDPFQGQEDLKNKIIRTVGKPEERFSEDALRMMRAARFATTLGFTIEDITKEGITGHAALLNEISKERVREEFMKIIASERAMEGVGLLSALGLLKQFLPEAEEGIGVGQNKHHIYTVWEHNMRALDYGAKEKYTPLVRLAALFHDIAKPKSKRGDGPDSTFYGHDVLGAKMTILVMERLKFSRAEIDKVAKLVRWHLFAYEHGDGEGEETTDSSIRRLIKNVGEDNIEDLVKVRICDRIGSGVPKAVPYRLRHFQFRVEKILREGEAVKVTMLKINGADIMGILGIQPGPKIGHLLNALLEEVIDDPKKNSREYLEGRVKELAELSDEELIELRKKAEEKVDLVEGSREYDLKKKYYVQ